ncbi:carbohydrate ABC transporter permease [Homoserinibacter sp. GY 40078]|uniref:carbohydrate ABC transporter permease n=1 Tax=Homoserinibacter sp. GY 40078 TaxID=2603275 RepID=UPI0011C8AA69|nr:carbohydrate ABC transporter permease [Homoserinibacter sp. GY 40078]TXK18485.1 carbohydrate ABC transporter permease [Homoserinibacter sp. GY 40078]
MAVLEATAVKSPSGTRARGQARPPRLRGSRPQWGLHIAAVVLVLVGLGPYIFMLTTSFKDNQQFAESYWLPAFPLRFENFATAWTQISPYLLASVIVAAGSIVAIVAISLVTGFVLARYRFVGRTFFFTMVAALMMIPGIASLIPLFVMVKDMGLINTYLVLMIPHISGGIVLGTILMKTFIEGIPQTLFDAAQLDGAGGVRIFASIMLPLSLPVVGTVGLITVNGVWNDFFWPLLTITQNELRTASVGLLFFQSQSGTNYGPMFAGYLLASIPLVLLFTFLSKYFLAGVQGGLPGSH